MPDRELWEKFFQPEIILKTLGLTSQTGDIAEFGCGYGTFTIPAAQIIQGKVFAFDIESEMVRYTRDIAQKRKINNIETILRDFIAEGTGLKEASVDYAMLFNILHLEKPVELLQEAYRILKPSGTIGILHWNYDPSTPRGPAMEFRPKPEQCIGWATEAGFVQPIQYDLKPYHYGITLIKGGD